MVYFHPGSFFFGSTGAKTDLAGPGYFLDRNVVLVTVQYRLGSFGRQATFLQLEGESQNHLRTLSVHFTTGFLSTEDSEAPGNYGLLDQTMALK